MKVETLLTKAKKEIRDEKSQATLELVKVSLKEIAGAKKTLRMFEKAHKKLLNTNVDDLELDGFEYE